MNKMFFKFLILCCSLLFGVNAHAQYAGAKYEKGPSSKMEILQVDNRELSTMVYMAYTTPDTDNWNETSSWMNFGDKTFIQVEGSSKQYHMISTINMPINSEAENKYMMFDRKNQRHQFILEFEKIPEGKSFDIIEDVNNSNAFNFYGVTYTPTDSSSYVNVDEFIAGYPVKEMGRYVVKGNTVSYVKFKDIIVNITPFLAKQYGKYYNMNIRVQNFSKKSILFNPNNIKVEGYNFKVDKSNNTYIPQQVDLQLLSYADYDKIVKREQNWDNFWVALGEGMAAYGAGQSTSTTTYSGRAYTTGSAYAYGYAGNTYGYANAYGSSYTTTYGQSTTKTYDGAAAYAAQQRANENYANYANSQSQIRQQLGDGYVKMNTIPSGADYSGYFNIKYKKITRMSLEIVIDGEVYPFTFVENQTSRDMKTRYEPDYRWEVRAGWGIVPFPSLVLFAASSLNHLADGADEDKDGVALGDISIDAERKLNRWLAVGLDLSWDRMTSRSSGPSQDHVMDVVALMPCATANYLTRENVTLYGKAEVGAALWLTECDSPQVLFAFQAAPIGVTFGHKFYGFAEASVGTLYIGGKLGVGFRF